MTSSTRPNDINAPVGADWNNVTRNSDIINRPAHYTHGEVEPINAIESWDLGFHLGNVVKYIARADHKGSRLDDLRKAAWYLEREIEREKIEVGLRELVKNAPAVCSPSTDKAAP